MKFQIQLPDEFRAKYVVVELHPEGSEATVDGSSTQPLAEKYAAEWQAERAATMVDRTMQRNRAELAEAKLEKFEKARRQLLDGQAFDHRIVVDLRRKLREADDVATMLRREVASAELGRKINRERAEGAEARLKAANEAANTFEKILDQKADLIARVANAVFVDEIGTPLRNKDDPADFSTDLVEAIKKVRSILDKPANP